MLSQKVLKCFGDSFDFQGQPLVVALRMFLSAFRLPGEAQQIDRVVQVIYWV
jgi:guanine nucleotide exchange protein RalF